MKHLFHLIPIAAASLVVGCAQQPVASGTSAALWQHVTSGYLAGLESGSPNATAMSEAADTSERRATSSDLQAASVALVAAKAGNWPEMNDAIAAISSGGIRRATVDSLSDAGFPVSSAVAMKGHLQ
jgi:hypothetical protein